MIEEVKATEMRVCFSDRLKNADILVGTTDLSEARRIARLWGERSTGERVTRTICRRQVKPHGGETTRVDGITVWLPLF